MGLEGTLAERDGVSLGTGFSYVCPQGELDELVARVIEVGKTSRTMEVKLLAEQLLSGKRQQCTRGRFVLVALDSRGRPTTLPKVPSPSIQRQGS